MVTMIYWIQIFFLFHVDSEISAWELKGCLADGWTVSKKLPTTFLNRPSSTDKDENLVKDGVHRELV